MIKEDEELAENIRSIGKWISIIDRYNQMYIEREYRSTNLGQGQIHILLTLFQKDNISQDSLSKELKLDKTTVTRAIKKLEESGYIIRVPSSQDRRVNLIYLTDKAKSIQKEISSTMLAWTEILSDGFTAEEKEQFLNMLRRTADNAVSYIGQSDK